MAYTTINKGSDYIITHLYSGNSSTNNQSVGLTPDLVWVKCRNVGSPTQHYIVDKVRGDRKYISSNTYTAEQTDGSTFDLVSGGFDLDGGNGWTNLSGRTYASWNWVGGGTGVSNTDGSITSTVSANTTSGFSVVTYAGNSTSGATIGHGLGATPKMIIIKNRDTTDSWNVYHSSIGNTGRIFLDTTGTVNTTATAWNNTSPTSSVFTVGDNTGVNSSNLVAYCFAEVKGFSKIGSYIGNGSNDGPFIYTGFRPAFVLTKGRNNISNWTIQDNLRAGYNPNNNRIYPNDQAEENTTSFRIDIFSNGFKINNSDTDNNTSGSTFLYAAFAEFPIVSSTGTPVTAR